MTESVRAPSTDATNGVGSIPGVAEALVSVVVRSFNRVPALCELLAALLRQTWTNFEIVVVEQSSSIPPDAAERLADLARDARVVIVRRPPLGGAAARNVGVGRARGEIFLFIDDDDLPVGDDWIATHVRALSDPNCLGASGKHVHSDEREHRFSPFMLAVTRTLSYDPILKISTTYVQHDHMQVPVDAIHGSNASLRRSAWERFGGWDEDTAIEDEVSFCFRALRGKRPEEYFSYDPRPAIVRQRDIVGGLDKRNMASADFYGHYIDYIHRIIGRYHPLRVVLLYPLYVIASYFMAVGTLWAHSRKYRGFVSRLGAALELLLALPVNLAAAWYRLLSDSPTGKVRSARAPVEDAIANDPGPIASP
jgi:glycosyltransferase involved in cell wall biosynthesis